MRFGVEINLLPFNPDHRVKLLYTTSELIIQTKSDHIFQRFCERNNRACKKSS